MATGKNKWFDPENRVKNIIADRTRAKRYQATTEGVSDIEFLLKRMVDALEGMEAEAREQTRMGHRIQRALEHINGSDDLVASRMVKILTKARKEFLKSRCGHMPPCNLDEDDLTEEKNDVTLTAS